MNWAWGRGKPRGGEEWLQGRTGQQMTFKDSETNLLWQAPAWRSSQPARKGYSEKPFQTNSLTVVNTRPLSISHFVYRKYTKISLGVNLLRAWAWVLVPLKPSHGLRQGNGLEVCWITGLSRVFKLGRKGASRGGGQSSEAGPWCSWFTAPLRQTLLKSGLCPQDLAHLSVRVT